MNTRRRPRPWVQVPHFHFILKAACWTAGPSGPPRRAGDIGGGCLCVCVCVCLCCSRRGGVRSGPFCRHTQPGMKRAETHQRVLAALPPSSDQTLLHPRFMFPAFSRRLIPAALSRLVSPSFLLHGECALKGCVFWVHAHIGSGEPCVNGHNAERG